MRAPVVLALGFRVFFLLGLVHGTAAMAVWLATLRGVPLLAALPATAWHAHEMVYGFARAVVAGFLLTAVRNWTAQPTPTGWALGALAATWLVPRGLLAVGGPSVLPVAAAFDLGFGVALVVAVARPVVAARQWRQAGIVAKLALLVVGEGLFYAGALGWLASGVAWGTGAGLYLVVALALTIANRVTGSFVRSALPGTPEIVARPWRDRIALVAFLALFAFDVFAPWPLGASLAAAVLVGVHAARLRAWWAPGVARRPLLWVLFAAYAWFVLGFALQAATPVLATLGVPVPPPIPRHALGVGGLGVLMLGMVARVSLGHTGRDVRATHAGLGIVFAVGLAAAAVRVVGPWLLPGSTATSLAVAAALWIVASGALAVWGAPLWLAPRPDGRPG